MLKGAKISRSIIIENSFVNKKINLTLFNSFARKLFHTVLKNNCFVDFRTTQNISFMQALNIRPILHLGSEKLLKINEKYFIGNNENNNNN